MVFLSVFYLLIFFFFFFFRALYVIFICLMLPFTSYEFSSFILSCVFYSSWFLLFFFLRSIFFFENGWSGLFVVLSL